MYTFEVTDDPAMARIFYDNSVVDVVGPWESMESAQAWSESYINKMNLGIN